MCSSIYLVVVDVSSPVVLETRRVTRKRPLLQTSIDWSHGFWGVKTPKGRRLEPKRRKPVVSRRLTRSQVQFAEKMRSDAFLKKLAKNRCKVILFQFLDFAYNAVLFSGGVPRLLRSR